MKNFLPKLIVLAITIMFSLNGFSQSAKYIPTAGVDPLGANGASIDMQQPDNKSLVTVSKDEKKSSDYSIDAKRNEIAEPTVDAHMTGKMETVDKFHSLIAFSNSSDK